MIDSMVVAHGGHLAVFVLRGVGDVVCARVARARLEGFLGEGGKRRRGKREEDFGHCIPGPADERVAPVIVLAAIGLPGRPGGCHRC